MTVPGRPRRRAVYVNEADRQRLEAGLTPSWDEVAGDGLGSATDPDEVVDSQAGEAGGNDRRLQDDVPPHW